jgi:2-polyprenyl-3-methyl-5-hydroxy-6-metoxy-1,4-benzoquinol methylase
VDADLEESIAVVPDGPTYPLTRSAGEYERLRRQAGFLGGTTDRLFRAAGIESGMRVLDVGCGAGDVALLAAGLVGSGGEVVGVDTDRSALEVARGRAVSSPSRSSISTRRSGRARYRRTRSGTRSDGC